MKLVIDSIPNDIVLAIGKFEGLHLGHQLLINDIIKKAHEIGKKSAVMVFEPHPYVLFAESARGLILTAVERDVFLDNLGVDYLLQFTFDKHFANLSPEQFCQLVFTNCKHVHVGENYKFGKNRAGDALRMQQEAQKFNATVEVIKMQEGISTSQIHTLLSAANIQEANNLLGYTFHIVGQTKKGKQLGRTIGFPTLNIYPPENKLLPPDGVYQTVTSFDNETYCSITNIGLRPTVDSTGKVRSVETHLFGYEKNEELYNTPIKVEFTRFIRPEIKFASLDELKAQITKDIRVCPTYFQTR